MSAACINTLNTLHFRFYISPRAYNNITYKQTVAVSCVYKSTKVRNPRHNCTHTPRDETHARLNGVTHTVCSAHAYFTFGRKNDIAVFL